MKILGIIPARGGSKGVPGKNIKIIDGKPLIGYSIEVAQQSKCFDKLILTTDCDKTITIAKKFKCDYLKRNPLNAEDSSPIEPVINEVIDTLDEDYDLIILLQPTAPIREVSDVKAVIKMFENDPILETVVSVVALEDIHPARMYSISNDSTMYPLNPNLEKLRRQELQSVYIRNGAFYASKYKTYKSSGKLINSPKKAYVMPESKWVNIDTPKDLMIAEVLIKEWKKGKLS
jgi:CMP-N,N'-diacetyllegionaminic acid synthase